MRGEFTVLLGYNYDVIIEFSPQRKLHEKKNKKKTYTLWGTFKNVFATGNCDSGGSGQLPINTQMFNAFHTASWCGVREE